MSRATSGALNAAKMDVSHQAGTALAEPMTSPVTAQPTFSVVVPVCNERAGLPELYRRVKAVMDQISDDWELVLVDDGSLDQSAEMIALLCAQDDQVRGIRLTRNFGSQIAVTAGLDAARGRAVVLLDANLQDPPEVIPELVSQWRAGFDVVYGVRSGRTQASWFKRATMSGFSRLIQHITHVDISLDAGDFLLMDRRVVDAIKQMPERQRFLRGMVSWIGYKQTEVNYQCQPRSAGETNLTFGRMLDFVLDAMTGFSTLPLQFASYSGFAAVLLSGLVIAMVVLSGPSGAGQAWLSQLTTVAMVLFLGGVQLICTGIVGAYLGRVYGEMKQRPLYLVDQRWGFTEQTKR
ncbi:MAG: glycosyltransferase family 2 protein [Chloroflexi bacterium]|nr:glycosyltransferase family 2 protein [Chloroflexota bacterium]